MNRVKRYFNKPWNPTVMKKMNPIPDNVHAHLRMVYWTLFATIIVSSFGAYSHLFYNIGGWTTTLIFVASITWLLKVQSQRELSRLMLLLTAAYCFGASIGPLINFIVVVDQSDIIRVVVGASVFFFCYTISAIYSQERDVIYGVAEFLVTILVPTWMVLFPKFPELNMPTYILGMLIPWGTAVFIHDLISPKFKIWFDLPIQAAWFGFLRYHFSFNVFHLWLIYLSLLPFTISMMTHSEESIYKACHGENNYVNHTIAFFTDFPACTVVTTPRHIGSVMLNKIWGLLRAR